MSQIRLADYAFQTLANQGLGHVFLVTGEGAALQGAKKLIRACKPTVAVCAYHRPDDLWRLPLQLIEMNRNYRFFLRSYDYDGWETVLYAVDKSIPKNN
jgi:hypothetical protein